MNSELTQGKRKRLDSDSDSETNVSAERTLDFYQKENSFKIGLFKVRLFFSPQKFAWRVNIMKLPHLDVIPTQYLAGQKPSHFDIPSSDIPWLARTFRDQVREVRLSSLGLEKDKIKFLEDLETFKSRDFWTSPFCKTSPSGKVIVRPYKDAFGSCYVRMLQAKKILNPLYPDWLGSSASWPTQESLEFAEVLDQFQSFIKASDTAFSQAILSNPELVTQDRPSPNKMDLKNIDEIVPVSLKVPMTVNVDNQSPREQVEEELSEAEWIKKEFEDLDSQNENSTNMNVVPAEKKICKPKFVTYESHKKSFEAWNNLCVISAH